MSIVQGLLPSRIQCCACLSGLLISFGALFWGLAYPFTLAIFLLLLIGAFCLLPHNPLLKKSRLARHGTIILIGVAAILLLQLLLPLLIDPLGLTTERMHLPPSLFTYLTLYDHRQWLESLGGTIMLALGFYIALSLSYCSHAKRLFFDTLLISAVFITSVLYFSYENNRLSALQAYTHGFINPNIAASYLGIMLMIALWKLHYLSRRLRRKRHQPFPEWLDGLRLPQTVFLMFTMYAIVLFSITIILTGSRGGIAVSAGALLFYAVILIVKKAERRQLVSASQVVLFFVVSILLLGVLFSIFRIERMESIFSDGLDLHERPQIYLAMLPMIADHPLFGIGLGNFAAVFPSYKPEGFHSESIINIAHNSYLELLAELGIIGFSLVAYGGVLLLIRIIRQLRIRRRHYGYPALGLSVAALAGTHSLIDAPLQIPSIALLVLFTLVLCASPSIRRQPTHKRTYPEAETPEESADSIAAR